MRKLDAVSSSTLWLFTFFQSFVHIVGHHDSSALTWFLGWHQITALKNNKSIRSLNFKSREEVQDVNGKLVKEQETENEPESVKENASMMTFVQIIDCWKQKRKMQTQDAIKALF